QPPDPDALRLRDHGAAPAPSVGSGGRVGPAPGSRAGESAALPWGGHRPSRLPGRPGRAPRAGGRRAGKKRPGAAPARPRGGRAAGTVGVPPRTVPRRGPPRQSPGGDTVLTPRTQKMTEQCGAAGVVRAADSSRTAPGRDWRTRPAAAYPVSDSPPRYAELSTS